MTFLSPEKGHQVFHDLNFFRNDNHINFCFNFFLTKDSSLLMHLSIQKGEMKGTPASLAFRRYRPDLDNLST